LWCSLDANKSAQEANRIAADANRIATASLDYDYASPAELRYDYSNRNTLKDGKFLTGVTTIRVRNLSDKPTLNVRIVINPLTSDPAIEGLGIIETREGFEGDKTIVLEEIAAGQVSTVVVSESVSDYEVGLFEQNPHFYFLNVAQVYTELGRVSCDYTRVDVDRRIEDPIPGPIREAYKAAAALKWNSKVQEEQSQETRAEHPAMTLPP